MSTIKSRKELKGYEADCSLDLRDLYEQKSQIKNIHAYLKAIDRMPLDGKTAVLTGRAPVWLYLKVAHHLHGRVKKLYYQSPAAGKILIFDHDPYDD